MVRKHLNSKGEVLLANSSEYSYSMADNAMIGLRFVGGKTPENKKNLIAGIWAAMDVSKEFFPIADKCYNGDKKTISTINKMIRWKQEKSSVVGYITLGQLREYAADKTNTTECR